MEGGALLRASFIGFVDKRIASPGPQHVLLELSGYRQFEGDLLTLGILDGYEARLVTTDPELY